MRSALKSGSLTKQPQPNNLNESNWNDERRVFMWKIKFDQPYLMWREWREITKRILSEKKKAGDNVAERGRLKLAGGVGRHISEADNRLAAQNKSFKQDITLEQGCMDIEQGEKSRACIQEGQTERQVSDTNEADESSIKRMEKGKGRADQLTSSSSIRADKIGNPETRLYATWVEDHMQKHPEAFVQYQENKGIIAVRETFLQWKKETTNSRGKTKELPESENQKTEAITNGTKAATISGHSHEKVENADFNRTIIVPVAVPGCGQSASNL